MNKEIIESCGWMYNTSITSECMEFFIDFNFETILRLYPKKDKVEIFTVSTIPLQPALIHFEGTVESKEGLLKIMEENNIKRINNESNG